LDLATVTRVRCRRTFRTTLTLHFPFPANSDQLGLQRSTFDCALHSSHLEVIILNYLYRKQLKKTELSDHCKTFGLAYSGNMATLTARLEAFSSDRSRWDRCVIYFAPIA
jgi:hypothetical protein